MNCAPDRTSANDRKGLTGGWVCAIVVVAGPRRKVSRAPLLVWAKWQAVGRKSENSRSIRATSSSFAVVAQRQCGGFPNRLCQFDSGPPLQIYEPSIRP